jgi:hypothetical protein
VRRERWAQNFVFHAMSDFVTNVMPPSLGVAIYGVYTDFFGETIREIYGFYGFARNSLTVLPVTRSILHGLRQFELHYKANDKGYPEHCSDAECGGGFLLLEGGAVSVDVRNWQPHTHICTLTYTWPPTAKSATPAPINLTSMSFCMENEILKPPFSAHTASPDLILAPKVCKMANLIRVKRAA